MAAKTEKNLKVMYLVGNPNVGKSVIFSALTSQYVTISNFPGTTVEVTRGLIPAPLLSGQQIELIDTPGVNSLAPLSEDEQVTRNILWQHARQSGEKPEVVLVIDAKNLRRGLLLALQLTYAGIPFFVVLNMMDEATALGVHINKGRLEKLLGVPVIEAIAIQKEGINRILETMRSSLTTGRFQISLPAAIESFLSEMSPLAGQLGALSLLYNDKSLLDFLSAEEIQKAEKILTGSNISPGKIHLAWLENSNAIMAEVYQKELQSSSGFLSRLGRWSIHPVSGMAIMLLALLAVYQFVGILGAGILVNFLEKVVFGAWLLPWITAVFDWLALPDFLHQLFVGEYGLISMGVTYAVAIILPVVMTFFIAFSFLEDSGYLPRMGAMLNSVFKFMGLNGKAVLPMVLGLGCDTMATMTARVLDSKKERIIVTLLLALGVPCSAQMGVIFALGTSLPAVYMLAWALIIFFTLVLVGFLSSLVIPGKPAMFLMELPPLRLPSAGNVLKKTYMRSKWYLKEATPLFILGAFILFLLHSLQILPAINEALRPVTRVALGLPEEAAESLVMGFLRRDFGAAGFLKLYSEGLLNYRQTLVSLVVITLFIPCIANFLMIIKERGIKTGLAMFAFIIPFAILTGALINSLMLWFGW